MIVNLKNEQGYIYAFAEFNIVDLGGKPENNGRYMYVREIWIHKDYSGKFELPKLILMLDSHPESRFIKYVYWLRDNDRPSKLFNRETALRRIKILSKGAIK